MADTPTVHRFYGELAVWWPLISPFHLKASFAMPLVDLSEAMLDASRRLNPDCEHRRGDMETAFVHCRPGGVAVFVPDSTRENFEETTDLGGSDGDDGRGVRYLEWAWDPNPDTRTSVVRVAQK